MLVISVCAGTPQGPHPWRKLDGTTTIVLRSNRTRSRTWQREICDSCGEARMVEIGVPPFRPALEVPST